MSNPLRAPKEPLTYSQMNMFPSACRLMDDEWSERHRRGKDVAFIEQQLSGKDMELARTIVLPKEHCVEKAVLVKPGQAFALAKNGKQQCRIRSAEAYRLAQAMWEVLPRTGGFESQAAVRVKAADRFHVDGGTENCLGRLMKAYPDAKSRIKVPITAAEARAALVRCGLEISALPAAVWRAYPLVPVEGEEGLSINAKSDNGFPVGGQWDTPGAQEKIFGLAQSVRGQIVQAYNMGGRDGVVEWKARQEESRPWLVALKGKAKADYYPNEKLNKGQMRFYNAFPRQVMLNIQVASQPMEKLSRTVVDGPGLHSGVGVSLAHGGADDLVEALERQLKASGDAYVHVGDDSWVVVRVPKGLVFFALDCSNFDLTQHADATLHVHQALADELSLIDKPAAALWYAYARERLVVVCGAVVRKWRHAGPSGMPLQTKVNDMLMDVMITRVLSRLDRYQVDETEWDNVIHTVGQELGFSVRVEQLVLLENVRSIREGLQVSPFLFIGYYFHVLGGKVTVVCDLPRTMAQMPYPGQKWAHDKKELAIREAMRLGSMYMSAGVPTVPLRPAFAAWQQYVVALLEKVIAEHGNVQDDKLKWAVGEAVHGPATEASLKGLLAAVQRPSEVTWIEKPAPLPSTSVFVSAGTAVSSLLGSWADEAADEEEERMRAMGGFVPPPGRAVRALPLAKAVVPTHPVTMANDGRPPPTAVWGPDKPKREHHDFAPRGRGRRESRFVEDEVESHAISDISSEFEDDDDYQSFYSDESDGPVNTMYKNMEPERGSKRTNQWLYDE